MKESVIERPGGSPARALPGREPSGREPLERVKMDPQLERTCSPSCPCGLRPTQRTKRTLPDPKGQRDLDVRHVVP